MIAYRASETFSRVAEILALFVPAELIDERAFLAGDLCLSWTDRLCLVCELDETFRISISDRAMQSWETVEDVATTVAHLESRRR